MEDDGISSSNVSRVKPHCHGARVADMYCQVAGVESGRHFSPETAERPETKAHQFLAHMAIKSAPQVQKLKIAATGTFFHDS